MFNPQEEETKQQDDLILIQGDTISSTDNSVLFTMIDNTSGIISYYDESMGIMFMETSDNRVDVWLDFIERLSQDASLRQVFFSLIPDSTFYPETL
jgi:hypothetical protein